MSALLVTVGVYFVTHGNGLKKITLNTAGHEEDLSMSESTKAKMEVQPYRSAHMGISRSSQKNATINLGLLFVPASLVLTEFVLLLLSFLCTLYVTTMALLVTLNIAQSIITLTHVTLSHITILTLIHTHIPGTPQNGCFIKHILNPCFCVLVVWDAYKSLSWWHYYNGFLLPLLFFYIK